MAGKRHTRGMRSDTVILGETHVHVERAAKQKYKGN